MNDIFQKVPGTVWVALIALLYALNNWLISDPATNAIVETLVAALAAGAGVRAGQVWSESDVVASRSVAPVGESKAKKFWIG